MLPLSLLKAAENQPMLIELKNGDTYNGRLVGCNAFMNICLKDVICTSKDGDRFWKMPECYIRGNSIKYMRIPDEIIELVAEEEINQKRAVFRGGRGAGRASGGRLGDGHEGQGRGSYYGGRGDSEGRGGAQGRGRGEGGRGWNRGGNFEGGRGGRGGRDGSGRFEGGRGGREGRGFGGRARGEGRGGEGRGRN